MKPFKKQLAENAKPFLQNLNKKYQGIGFIVCK